VLSDSPIETPHVAESRSRGDEAAGDGRTTSSRAAEHLFWLGRYAERSENCARLVRAALLRLAEADAVSLKLRGVILDAGRRHGILSPASLADAGRDEATTFNERALIESLFDRESCQGLGFNIDQTVRVAGAVRDRLSSDNWRILNRLSEEFVCGTDPVDLDEALDLVDRAILALVAVGGLEMAHMTRDDGWRFLTLGRHLERLWFVASTLEDVAAQDTTDDASVLEWLLELSDSLITYRARHMRHPEWRPVVDLLLLDARNPRSAAFQVAKLGKHVRLLPDANLGPIQDDIDLLTRACRGMVIEQRDLFGDLVPIEGLVAACRRLAPRVADALTLQYFNHVDQRPYATATV
jgi:uncharacterized alpha-E superfamily protein